MRDLTMSLLAAVMLVALGPGPAAAQTRSVTVGVIGVGGEAPFFLALERGYFAERGVQVIQRQFSSAGPMMAPLSTGELQVIPAGGVNVPLFNAVARGLPVMLAASTTKLVPGNDSDAFMVRTDLRDAIRTAADLRGRKIAINAAASPFVYALGKALATAGLTLKDMEIVYIPFPDQPVALDRKAVDVAVCAEPTCTIIEGRGFGVVWKRFADFISNPYMQISTVYMNSEWARANPQVATDFLVAWLKGARDYWEAARKGQNRPAIIEILIKHTRLKDRALYEKMPWNYISPNGTQDVASIQDQQDFYLKNGFVTQSVPLDKVIDDTYLKRALAIVGTYPEN